MYSMYRYRTYVDFTKQRLRKEGVKTYRRW